MHATDAEGFQPMHAACANDRLEVAQCSENSNEPSSESLAARLAWSVGKWNWSRLVLSRWLRSLGATHSAANKDGATPMLLACQAGCLDTARWLRAEGASLTADDNDGDQVDGQTRTPDRVRACELCAYLPICECARV